MLTFTLLDLQQFAAQSNNASLRAARENLYITAVQFARQHGYNLKAAIPVAEMVKWLQPDQIQPVMLVLDSLNQDRVLKPIEPLMRRFCLTLAVDLLPIYKDGDGHYDLAQQLLRSAIAYYNGDLSESALGQACITADSTYTAHANLANGPLHAWYGLIRACKTFLTAESMVSVMNAHTAAITARIQGLPTKSGLPTHVPLELAYRARKAQEACVVKYHALLLECLQTNPTRMVLP